MRISVSSFFGIILGSALLGWGVYTNTDKPEMFWSSFSLIIVLGGTVFASFIGFRGRYNVRALIQIPALFAGQKVGPKTLTKDVGMVVEWAKRVQKEGKKASEAIIAEQKEPFLKYLWGLYASGYSADEISEFAETQIEEDYFRHLNEVNILSTMAAGAPAFGMVGTLLGLIIMLSDMDDPSKMGPGLSTALMTTLYGVLLARFFFQPASSKLKQKQGITRFRRYLITTGVTLIAQGKTSFYITDKLNSYLDIQYQYTDGDANAK
jgi:chemotaxis protein MotA